MSVCLCDFGRILCVSHFHCGVYVCLCLLLSHSMVVSPLKWQLSAESNTLGVQGVAAVLKGLAANKALTALDLCDNDLDEQSCSDEQMLAEYKQQQGVERGFRFLKDPWFIVDSIFLKSPKRIEALMMVMTLCLLVYNVTQYRLREALKTQKETLPNQLNKPIQNPTLRWIFQLMEGISIVTLPDTMESTQEFVTNLTEVRQKIIRLFGKTAGWMYGIIIPQNSADTLGM